MQSDPPNGLAIHSFQGTSVGRKNRLKAIFEIGQGRGHPSNTDAGPSPLIPVECSRNLLRNNPKCQFFLLLSIEMTNSVDIPVGKAYCCVGHASTPFVHIPISIIMLSCLLLVSRRPANASNCSLERRIMCSVRVESKLTRKPDPHRVGVTRFAT